MRLSFITGNHWLRYLFIPAILLLFAGTLPVQAQAQTLTAREIVERADARDDGDNITVDSEMILIDKNGHQRKRLLKSFIMDKGDDTWRAQFFVEPADVRDTAFLTYDYYSGEKDDDQWIYLPELHKTKRIASSDKSSAFMGSDFSYADMNRRVLDEWSYKLLKESTVDGHKVWLVETTPINKVVEERYGYTKSVLFIRQDIFFPVRAVHWVKAGKKIKYMEVKKLEQVDGIWVAVETHMKSTKSKKTTHRTILRWQNVKMNQAIDEDMFTIRRIEKGL